MANPVVKSEAGTMGNGNLSPNPAAAAPNTKPHQLLHNPGLAVEWSAEEQSILDESLVKFGNEIGVWKYIKIAALLAEKTVRDVALRCRWMSKKEIGKRRKPEEQNASKRSKDKKDKTIDTKPILDKGNNNATGMYPAPQLPIDTDDGITNDVIGGTAGELFEQNLQVVVQIRANLAACKAHENTDLFVKFRDNLYAIHHGMSNSGVMSQMPDLQVSINTELADTILPKSLHQSSPLQS